MINLKDEILKIHNEYVAAMPPNIPGWKEEDSLDFLTPFEQVTIEEFVRNEMMNVSVGICNRIKRDALEIKRLKNVKL